MAAYDYLCRDCGAVTEVRASFAEKAEGLAPTCTDCSSTDLRRLFSPVAVGASGAPVPAGSAAAGGCCGGGCCS